VVDFYDIDRANARLPELTQTLELLGRLRTEVVGLRDRVIELNAPWAISATTGSGGTARRAEVDEETRVLRMRLQGMVDQMQAAVAQIDGWGIQLRHIESGLVDFPALVSGRPVWLCWRLGEPEIGWWHEVDQGFDSRRRLEDLV